MVDVKEVKGRANLVNQVKNLTEEGKSLLSKGIAEYNVVKSRKLIQEGRAKLDEAQTLREEFWKKYPNTLILHNCPWMSKDVSN